MSETPKPDCWTEDCDKKTGAQIMVCWYDGNPSGNRVRKCPEDCYLFYQHTKLSESGGDLRSAKYKEGNGREGQKARRVWGRK